MGFGKMFKQFFNDEALGDQTVETIEAVFLKAQRQQPHEEPHAWLASTWLNRIKAKGQNIGDPDIRMMAFTETYLHACVKPPLCARSLGLYFLYKKNLNIIEKYPKFAVEYASLIGPVLKAQEEGTIDQLYRRYNPVMAQDIDNEGIDGSHKVVSSSGRIEPLDIMTALEPTRDGISRHDEDKTGKGQSVSELNTSLFRKGERHRSEPRDTANSKQELSDTIAKIREQRAANQHRKPRKIVVSLCEKLILREWAYLDDLPRELANTVANIYYRYCEVGLLVKAAKKGDISWSDVLRELGIDRIEQDVVSPVPKVFRAYQAHVMAEYKAINEMISAVRQVDRDKNPDEYKIAVELALLSMKYNVDLSALKKGKTAAIKNQVEQSVVDEIPNLIDLLDL